MEQQNGTIKKYEPLLDLSFKLEKYINVKINGKHNVCDEKKEELKRLKKETTDKLNSMKEKGLEDTYIYEKYRGEQEETIVDKEEELESLLGELESWNSLDYGISEDDFIIFISNDFKINKEILKNCMQDVLFKIEDCANDILKRINLLDYDYMRYWEDKLSSIETL